MVDADPPYDTALWRGDDGIASWWGWETVEAKGRASLSVWGVMGFLFRIFCSLILALGVGYYSARWAIYELSAAQAVTNGVWRINPSIGSEESDPYTRAYVAVTAFLALNRSEAIYFFAESDDNGEMLDTNCNYIIYGPGLAARWWTITAYGPDNFLMENPENRYAVSSSKFDGERFSFTAGKKRPENGLWLPLGDAETFSLTLRAYNPETTLLDNLATAALPKIKKEGCT